MITTRSDRLRSSVALNCLKWKKQANKPSKSIHISSSQNHHKQQILWTSITFKVSFSFLVLKLLQAFNSCIASPFAFLACLSACINSKSREKVMLEIKSREYFIKDCFSHHPFPCKIQFKNNTFRKPIAYHVNSMCMLTLGWFQFEKKVSEFSFAQFKLKIRPKKLISFGRS